MKSIKIGHDPYLDKDVKKVKFEADEMPHLDLFSKDDITVGNPSSNIAIGVLYTWKDDKAPKEIRDFVIKLSNYASITGYWRTTNGARYVFSNICKNPNINKLVLLVFDKKDNGHLVVDAMKNFYENGVSDNGLIIGCKAPNPRFEQVPEKAFERFLKQVDLLIVRNITLEKYAKIEELMKAMIQEPENAVSVNKFSDLGIEFYSKTLEYEMLYDDGARFDTPLKYELSGGAEEVILSDKKVIGELGLCVEADDLEEALMQVAGTVFNKGSMFRDQRNILTAEVRSLTVIVKDPLKKVPKHYSKEYLQQYVDEFMDGVKDMKNEFAYNYHDRIFNTFGDQPSKVVEVLKKDPNTRRCIISLWDVNQDLGNSSPPCLDFIWCVLRDEKLEFHVVYRSHHLATVTKSGKLMPGEGAFVPNLYALATLQEKMAKELGVLRGALVLTDFSGHLYISEVD